MCFFIISRLFFNLNVFYGYLISMVKELLIKDFNTMYKIIFNQNKNRDNTRLEFKIFQDDDKIIDGYIAISDKMKNSDWLELQFTSYRIPHLYYRFKDYDAIAELLAIRKIEDIEKPILDDKFFRCISWWIYSQGGDVVEKKILTAIELKNYDELKPILRSLIIGDVINIFYKYSDGFLNIDLSELWYTKSKYERKEPYTNFRTSDEFIEFFYKEIWNKLEEKGNKIELEIFNEFWECIMEAIKWYKENKLKLNKRKIWLLDILRAIYLIRGYEMYEIPYRYRFILNEAFDPFEIEDLKNFYKMQVSDIIINKYIIPLIEEKEIV